MGWAVSSHSPRFRPKYPSGDRRGDPPLTPLWPMAPWVGVGGGDSRPVGAAIAALMVAIIGVIQTIKKEKPEETPK